MLEVTGLTAGYGGVVAVRGLSLAVGSGQTVALLGPNGAGKSTTLACIAGIHQPSGGTVAFDGRQVTRLPARRRVAEGIALVPEGRHLFPDLDVVQNLRVGHAGTRRPSRRFDEFRDWTFDTFPRLRERAALPAGSLSGGEQQMLAIARALASEPRLLMLDEPSLGLAPGIVAQVYELLRSLATTTDIAILLVEQYAQHALAFADTALILRNGRVVAEGPCDQLRDNGALVESYLGGPSAA